jgi:hypothetical protein
MVLPLDLLIFVPSSASTMEWTFTFSNGISSSKWSPIMIMRATQRYIISRAVESRLVG